MKTNIMSKYLNTKKKKQIATGIGLALLLGVGGVSVYAFNKDDNTLILTTDSIKAELGQVVSTDINDYLNHDKVDSKDVKDIIKNTKSKNNFKYVVIEKEDENGNITKEQKDYPEVGNYKLDFSYKEEAKSVKVVVADTTAPEITAPDTIDVIQYTDLATFNFSELLQVTDYSDVEGWQINTSKVDINTVGQYDLTVSISDVHKNKAEKDMKINVVEAPSVDEGEVAVTEIVVDENGNKKTVVTKKASNAVSSTDSVSTGKPVENTNKVESGSGNSATKPDTSSGSTGGNSNKPTEDTGNNTPDKQDPKPDTPSHSHSWNTVTKVVHHEAETKTVHHEAITKTETITVVDREAYDEPIYETRYICNRCDFSTKDGGEITDHTLDVCGGGWKAGKVQIGTKHHDAITHQEDRTVIVKPAWDEVVIVKPAWDETVITGYKCSSCGATK